MRKLILLIAAALLAVACVPAQEIEHLHIGTDGVIEWDSDTALMAGDVQTFEVYIYEWGTVVDDQALGSLTLLATVPATLYAFDLTGYTGDLYAIGVREIVDRGGVISADIVRWSYVQSAIEPYVRFLIDPDGSVTVVGARHLRVQ